MAASTRIAQLLKESKDYDPDKRYMAANDLTNELLREEITHEASIQSQICQTLLQQLDDASIDVQGNAVRCIKRLAGRLPEEQLQDVAEKLTNCLWSGKAEFRDIYATCLKGLITDVPDSAGNTLTRTLFPRLNEGIGGSNAQEECADILTELFRRFVQIIYNSRIGEESVDSLVRLLTSQSLSLRKKVTQCLGASSAVLQPRQLQGLISLLLTSIQRASNKKDQLTYIQALSAVSRTVGYKLSTYLSEIFSLLHPKCSVRNLSLDSPDIDTDHEIIELALTTYENLVRKCPKDVTNFIPDLVSIMMELIQYDPNYTYDNMEQDDEDWGSDFEGSDDYSEGAGDDSSWKVRRAAVHVLDAIIKSRPDSLSSYYSQLINVFIDRLKEHDENVKLDIFSTFGNLIRSILVGDLSGMLQEESFPALVRTRSSAVSIYDQVPQIIQAVQKELQQKNVKTRQGLTQFLMEMALSLPDQLADQLPTLLPEIVKSLSDKANSTIRLETFSVLYRLIRQANNPEVFHAISHDLLPFIQEGISDEYFRITAESLRVAGALIKALNGDRTVVEALFQLILNRLDTRDIDQEVKQASIYSMAIILSSAGPSLRPPQVSAAVNLINERMRNEVTRQICLKSWVNVAQGSNAVDLSNSQELASAIQEMLQLLQKNSRSLRLATLEALVAILQTYSLDPASAQSLLSALPEFINEADLHLAQFSLEIAATLFEKQGAQLDRGTIQTVVANMRQLARSSVVQGAALSKLCDAFGTLASRKLESEDNLVSQLQREISGAGRHGIDSVSRCAAAVVLAGAPAFREGFIGNCLRNLNVEDALTQFFCLSLGYVGRQIDLSANAAVFNGLLQLFDNQNDVTRESAAYSLGGIASGNVNAYLSQLLQRFNVQQHRYLLLIALREVIVIHFSHMQPYLDTIKPLLFEHCDSQEESLRNLVAECLGKLFLASPELMLNEIINHLERGSPLARSTVVNSVKYAASGKGHIADSMTAIIGPLIDCLQDSELNIRKSALTSLMAVIHNSPMLVKPFIGEVVDKALIETHFKPELVRTVDLGPFKHQIDDGLPIRKAAFSLLENVLETLPDKIEHGILAACILRGLEDPSDEVQLLCHQILCKQQWSSSALLEILDGVVDCLQKTLQKQTKLLSNKQEVERATDMIRSSLRAIETLKNSIEVDTNLKFMEYYGRIHTDVQLQPILASIQSQREALMAFQ